MNSETTHNNQIKIATYLSTTISLFLCILKFFNLNITHSHSIGFCALDSAMDLFISLINLLTVQLTSKTKNKHFPKGFDKLTVIVTLFQSLIIFLFSTFMIKESIENLYLGQHHIHNIDSGIILLLIATIINILLVLYQKKVIKETGSLIIKADMLHYSSDILGNISLIIGMYIVKYFYIFWLDSIFAILLAIYLLSSIYNLFKISFFSLLDKNFLQESQYIQHLLIQSEFTVAIEDINVFFSGIKYTVEINNKNINLNAKEIDHVISLINNFVKKNENHCIGCAHQNNFLTENASFVVKFII